MNTENNLETYNAELKKELERVKAELELERSTNAKNRERLKQTLTEVEACRAELNKALADARKCRKEYREAIREVIVLKNNFITQCESVK